MAICLVATACPLAMNSAQTMMNAIAMLTAGPARITKIRFQTGWL